MTITNRQLRASQVVLVVKNPLANAGNVRDVGSIPGSGRSPGGGHGNPLQHSCLGNPIDKGSWQATVHRGAKDWTRLRKLDTQQVVSFKFKIQKEVIPGDIELGMLLLLLSRFSRVRLCATPQTAAHQAPLCLGFSRQEHWSGLPFPSPMHESEK